MKEFKVNAFERFIIRNHIGLRWSLYVVFLIAVTVFAATALNSWNIVVPLWAGFVIALILVVPIMWIDFIGLMKLVKITKISEVNLDLEATVEAADKMLDILKPKQLDYMGSATLIKAAALFDMGKADEAKNEVFDYLQKCDVKNAPYANMAENYALLAIFALNEDSLEEYEFNKNRIERCSKDSSKMFRFFFNKSKTLNELELCYRVHTEIAYDEELELSVLTFPEFKNGKPIPEEKRTPMSYIAAYSMLFDYFRRLNMQEKAHYYARKICRLANDQFKSYREAKEYLDNEDIAD